MHGHKKIFILFLGLALVFICACFNLKQPKVKIQFYTLEYASPRIADLKPLPVVLKVDRFSVAPVYNTNRIIYQDRSFKRDEYFYHKWRSNPGDLVTYFLSRDIRQSGLFKAVLPYDSRFPISYTLEGSVDQFLERNMDDNWEAVLCVSITLMAGNEPDVSKMVVFQKTYCATKACKRKNPGALAEAMSQAMKEISEKVIDDVYFYLKVTGG